MAMAARTHAKHVCHPLDDHKKVPCRSLWILEIFTPTWLYKNKFYVHRNSLSPEVKKFVAKVL